MKSSFGTALNCIDGRTQVPVIKWMQENYCVDYVDLITEPGMNKVLAHGNCDEIKRIRESTTISVTAHASNVVAVVGHYDCAANPVSNCKQYQEIIVATYVVKSWCLPVRVVGLWVDESCHVHVVRNKK